MRIQKNVNIWWSPWSEVISKLIGVNFRKSPGNINYSTFSPEWTKLCNMHQEKEKFNLFSAGVVLQTRFLPGRSQGWIQTGHWDRMFFHFILFSSFYVQFYRMVTGWFLHLSAQICSTSFCSKQNVFSSLTLVFQFLANNLLLNSLIDLNERFVSIFHLQASATLLHILISFSLFYRLFYCV